MIFLLSLEFEKNGEILTLTENDLFDFRFERGCFSGDSFELGGVNSNLVYCVIDNNTGRFPRGSFANSRLTLYIDGVFCGRYNTELPKRRNGVIEITAYDDMLKLDCEFPDTYEFPQTFWSVYAECVYEAGLASDISFDNYVLNSLFNNGVISHEYTEYVYANSCRNLVSGMAEWNGGFACINDDGKLQVDVFSKDVKKTLYSRDLMAFDYSDETVTFSKIRTSQKNKTYEMGDDTGYTLVIRNQYIGYGLEDKDFETYFGILYDHYKGFSLTPMTFTLAEPDFELKIGDRISVVDEEENVTVTGNISKIVVRGNCSMEVTCGGFGNIGSASNYKPTSLSRTAQAKTDAKVNGGVGKASAWDKTSEYFNDYENNFAGNKDKKSGTAYYATAIGYKTKAAGMYSFAAGSDTIASSYGSAALGQETTASGSDSVAMGWKTTASKQSSVAMGTSCKAAGNNSFAGGDGSEASGYASIAYGSGAVASSSSAAAFNDSTASGSSSFAAVNSTASGMYSFAAGDRAEAWGSSSVAVGTKCLATGSNAVAVGFESVARGTGCVALGFCAEAGAGSYGQTVVGKYNVVDTQNRYAFIVGNGVDENSRSNGLTLDWNGSLVCGSITTTDPNSLSKTVFLDHQPTMSDFNYTDGNCLVVQYDPEPCVDSHGQLIPIYDKRLYKVVNVFITKG